ncbi:unnamed protein product [Moneuplotes crassus]|uniref:Transcription elongation factor 1 homolog n=1 Tax=Euplotes crassus TaxID=5936 RepID=A0AAD2D7Z2_EUPCR|nr:unnamed protein product [Moneuplotes crassus]
MGRRKRNQLKNKKFKKYTVPTIFDCPFCAHHDSVEVRLEKGTNIAFVFCRICTSRYKIEVHHLMEPIDVYCAWIDKSIEHQKEMDEKYKKEFKAKIDSFKEGDHHPKGKFHEEAKEHENIHVKQEKDDNSDYEEPENAEGEQSEDEFE